MSQAFPMVQNVSTTGGSGASQGVGAFKHHTKEGGHSALRQWLHDQLSHVPLVVMMMAVQCECVCMCSLISLHLHFCKFYSGTSPIRGGK